MDYLILVGILFIIFAVALIVSSCLDEEPLYMIGGFICALLAFLAFATFNDYSDNLWTCCNNEIHSEYCSECGKAKPIECKGWTCCDHERDSDVKFCPDCGKARPTNDGTVNNIVVKNNENVEINVNDDSVVIVEDTWTCCDKEIDSRFCPDCGKQNDNNITSNVETITKEKSNNKGE